MTTAQALNGAGGFDDLDALLGESIALRNEAALGKNLREKMKKGKVAPEDKAEMLATLREWEARHVWDTVAMVAVFEHISCSCGFYSEVFSHIMHRQVHKHDKGQMRMVQSDTLLTNVPKLVAKQHSDVEVCAECAGQKGWNLESEEVIEWQA